MSSGGIYHAESFLDIRNLHIYGREDEVAILKQAYERSFTPDASKKPQVVWLKGNPGVGKSALVEHLFLSKDTYCAGKFEQLRTSMPYFALTQLLSRLCYSLEFAGHRISNVSLDDQMILSHLVPEISVVLTSSSVEDKDDDDDDDSLQDGASGAAASCKLEWGLERLKQALRCFLKGVCRVLESPLILFLDDLQWADLDTLEIVKDMLIDDNETAGSSNNIEEEQHEDESTAAGILFIGAFRDNEVQNDCHPLVQCMQSISEHVQQDPERLIMELHIMNLGKSTTNQLVADLLGAKPDEVAELSKLVYSKTDGNCFYTLHTLRHIHEKDLLYLSQGALQWEWDENGIRDEVEVSDNIAEFMTKKLQSLPQPTLHALTLAAFLGTKVNMELLEALLLFINPDRGGPPLRKLLQPAVEVNLIEINTSLGSPKVCEFTHDRVTAAVYDMIPEGIERRSLHLKIGLYLRSLIIPTLVSDDREYLHATSCDTSTVATTDANYWQLILAVDQLNRGAELIVDKGEQVAVAKMNMDAARQVLHTGAFKVATEFLETGIGLLGERRWETSYNLTLRLSVTLASVLYSNGHMEECLYLLEEIFANTACPEDRYQAYSIQLDVLEAKGETEQCIQVGLDTLEQLGHPKIPKKPHLGHMIVAVIAAKRAFKRMTDEEILSLPECKDRAEGFIMDHLNCISAVAYYRSYDELMVVAEYRVLQMSLKYGVTRCSSLSFCTHAISMAAMGDLEGAFRFAQLSMKLSERFPTNYRTAAFAHCLLYHLKKPIHECVNNSMIVYNAAFSKGDLRSAGLAVVLHCSMRYYAGLPLEAIARDAFAFGNQLKKYQQTLMFKYFLFTQRGLLELMDRTDELSHFLENIQDDHEFESFLAQDGDKNGLNSFWLITMESRFILGNLDSAIEFGEKSWKRLGPSGFNSATPSFLLFSALTALDAWKRRRKRRHWRMFRKCHKEIAPWVKKGNLNSRHMVLLLDAELAVVKKQKSDHVRSIFESSISLASRCGFVHHAALASERAGLYFLNQYDTYWAGHYLTNAHELYTEWGATAKIRQMDASYERLLTSVDYQSGSISFDGTPTSRRESNVSITGRSRLSDLAQVEAKREQFNRVIARSRRRGRKV